MSRANCSPAAVKLQHGFEMRGQRALVVGGAAAVQDAVADFGGEGIEAPLRALDGHYVLVSHQQHGLLRATAFEAGDDAGAACDWLENFVGDAFALEDRGDIARDLGLVSGRIRGVHLDQIAQEHAGLFGGFLRGEHARLLSCDGGCGEADHEGD